ncbi:LysR family transcriptional regulator [Pinisolibacter sp. B13]|nr:LysR family transcriptional regulator [Pinisolibacter aquiterrae]
MLHRFFTPHEWLSFHRSGDIQSPREARRKTAVARPTKAKGASKREAGEADERGGRDALPPLAALRAFEAVVRAGSMRRAALELRVGHAVLSRQVRRLEEWFGQRLLETGPRGVSPTEDGARLAATLTDAFDRIAATVADLGPTRGRRLLRLWCVPGLASRWLTPRLADLQAALPDVEIVLRATTEPADFARNDADAVIVFGETRPAKGRAERLEPTRLFPVAAPSLLAKLGPPVDLADIPRLGLLHEESREQWRRWFAAVGVARPGLDGPRLWYASSAVDAAVAGQGVALATRLQAADDLEAGRLVELPAEEVHLGDYWFVVAEDRAGDPLLARLGAWLARAVAAT